MKTKELTDNEMLQVNGGVSFDSVKWPTFGAAIMSYGGAAIPELEELVFAIRQKNWSCVAALALHSPYKELPIVENAMAAAHRA